MGVGVSMKDKKTVVRMQQRKAREPREGGKVMGEGAEAPHEQISYCRRLFWVKSR